MTNSLCDKVIDIFLSRTWDCIIILLFLRVTTYLKRTKTSNEENQNNTKIVFKLISIITDFHRGVFSTCKRSAKGRDSLMLKPPTVKQ